MAANSSTPSPSSPSLTPRSHRSAAKAFKSSMRQGTFFRVENAFAAGLTQLAQRASLPSLAQSAAGTRYISNVLIV